MTVGGDDLVRIAGLPLFQGAAPQTLSALTASAFLQWFPGGATLSTEGDRVDFLYILCEGMVELQARWQDRETTLAVLAPVSTFTLASAVLDAPALMTARTLERSQVLMLSSQALRAAMVNDGALSLAVAQEMAASYRGVVRAIKNQKLRGGVERLANYLLAQTEQAGRDHIILPYEKRLLASLLGMTPETLSRAFVALASYGVEVRGPEVIVHKPADLAGLARPTALIDDPAPRASDDQGVRPSPPSKMGSKRGIASH